MSISRRNFLRGVGIGCSALRDPLIISPKRNHV
ncbi:twin-arginine translocation signal domain-containing protein [Citrobacter freundii]